MGDKLYLYVTGANRKFPGSGLDATYTGLATLRRDGFASMDADATPGTLTTRPLRFSGRRLFVNLDAPRGTLRVEVLNPAGQPIAPLHRRRLSAHRGRQYRPSRSLEGRDGPWRLGGPAR